MHRYNKSYVPITELVALITTQISTTSCNGILFFRTEDHALISSDGVSPSGCAMLHYVLDSQLFPETLRLRHKESTLSLLLS